MKKIVYTLLLLVFSLSGITAINPSATIEWKKTSSDVGNIPFNRPVKIEFSFKNPGMVPIIIRNVESSCGCTVADFPKQPIISGGEGVIIITYDAQTEGYFSKTITVFSNIEGGMTNLYISGIVEK